MERDLLTGRVIGCTIEAIVGIHKAPMLSYMKLVGIITSLLPEFNVDLLKDGVTRFRL